MITLKNENNIFYYYSLYKKYKKKNISDKWLDWLVGNNYITNDKCIEINKIKNIYTLTGGELSYYKYFYNKKFKI